MKERTALLFLVWSSFALAASAGEIALWYDHPATDWERETLPLGNGRLGATVFGGVEQERITINEQSLWSGWPEPGNWTPGKYRVDLFVQGRKVASEEFQVLNNVYIQ